MKPLIISLSGTRAVIGETFHPQLAIDTALAFANMLQKGPIIVGGDTRVSYKMVHHAILSGLIAAGIDVIDIGNVTTPTLQQMIQHYQAPGGIMITASHNPIMWNGLKLMNASGSFLNDTEFAQFKDNFDHKNSSLATWDTLGTVTTTTNALELHIEKILANIDTSCIKNANLNVLVDANNGAGALANPILLDKLGVTYDILNPEPNGQFAHDPEPLKENLSQIMETLKEGNYDIGFVQDADADRLVILDENGHFIGEDYSFAYCVDHLLTEETTKNNHIVVNLSTSLVINHIAKKHNSQLTYTKIGEPNVTAGLKSENAQVGGEGNGGVIYPKIGWGRDSLVGIVAALKHLALSKKKVSETISTYPQYNMLRTKFQLQNNAEIPNILEKIKTTFSNNPQDLQDGVKVSFENSWLHLRPSNTEPIMRLFIEAESEPKCLELLKSVENSMA